MFLVQKLTPLVETVVLLPFIKDIGIYQMLYLFRNTVVLLLIL